MWYAPKHSRGGGPRAGIRDGQPFVENDGGGTGDLSTSSELSDRMRETVFPARVWKHDGGIWYKVLRHSTRHSVRGRWIRAEWLKSRSYDPPLLKNAMVLCYRQRDARYYILGQSENAKLGDIVTFCGSEPAAGTGWLACTKANNTAGAVNGITPPNLEGRFIVASGLATNQTLQAGDTAYDYAIGDTSGFNKHGATVNDHADHAKHTHEHEHTHTWGMAVSSMFANQGDPADPGTDVIEYPVGGHIQGTSDSPNEATTGEAAAMAHSSTDNRPVLYALGFKVFVGV